MKLKGAPIMFKTISKHWRTSFVVIAIVLGIFLVVNSAQADGKPKVPALKVRGKTIGDWSAKWWQWVQSIPDVPPGTNPMFGGDCEQNQKGPVWFLAGNQGGIEYRECTVPKGKSIFFPIVNVMYYNSGPDDITPVEIKRLVLDALFNETIPDFFNSRACEISCTLNGEPTVYHFPIVRTQSPPFRIEFPDAEWVDEEAVSDGFWVMLSPLPKGEHELHFTGGWCDLDDGTLVLLNEFVDLTYTLTVK